MGVLTDFLSRDKPKSLLDEFKASEAGKGLSDLTVKPGIGGGLVGLSLGEEAEQDILGESLNRRLSRSGGIFPFDPKGLSPTHITEKSLASADRAFGVAERPKELLGPSQIARAGARAVPGAVGFLPSAVEAVIDPSSTVAEGEEAPGRLSVIGDILLDFAKMPVDAILGIKAIISDVSKDDPHILRRKVIRHLEKTLGKGYKDLDFNEKMRLVEKSIASARGRTAAPVEDKLSQLITGGTVAETEERISQQVVAAPEGIPFGLAVGLGGIRGGVAAVRFGKTLTKAFKEGKLQAKETVQEKPSVTLPEAQPEVEQLPIAQEPSKFDPTFLEAVDNTAGASTHAEGITVDLARYQKPEQFGARSIRTGVFYLPEKGSPYRKYYSTGKFGYGGGELIEGTTTFRNPIIVKAGTGGAGVKKAYDQIVGKGAYDKMRSDVLSEVAQGRPTVADVAKLLKKYEGTPDLANEILLFSREGNLLPYAIQEHIAAHAVRKAGYDAVISHSKSGKKPRLSEVFDVRQQEFPDINQDLTLEAFADFYDKDFQKTAQIPEFVGETVEAPKPTATKPAKAKAEKVAPISALKLKDGKIISDPTAKIHTDIIKNKKVNPADVVDGGFIVDGKFKSSSSSIAAIGEQARAKERVAIKRQERIAKKVVTKPPEKTIALNKAEITSIRKNTGLDKLSKPEKRKWEQVLGEAKSAGLDKTALELTDEILNDKTTRNITDTEHAGMTIKADEIMNQYEATVKSASEFADKGNKEAARLEADRAEVLLDQLDRLTRASDKAGREVARALSIRRMRLNRDNYRLAEVMQRAKASKGSKLSDKQSKKFKELTDKNKSLESQIKEIEEKFQEQQAEIEKLAAIKITNRVGRRSKIKSKSEKQRKKVDKRIVDIKKELAGIGFRVNDITGVTAEGAFLVGKLAIAYIEKGAINLAEVVKLVLNDIPELTERDVYQSLIARDPKLQKKARSEVAKRIAQMKTQSKLLLDIEKAEKGIFDIKGKKPPEPAELKALRKTLRQLRKEAYKSAPDAGRLERALKTIDELQDQLDGGFRKVKNKKSVNEVDAAELKSAKEKIALLKKDMRVTDELSNLNEQMRTGEFEIKERPKPKEIPPELERKLIDLERVRVEIRQRIVDLGPKGFVSIAVETANTLRTLKATADMSYTLRQGFWLSTRRPIAAVRSAGIAAKSFFSKYTAEQVDLALRSADYHYLRERAKLFLSSIDAAKVTFREEAFMSNFLEKPWAGKVGIKQIVQASNRNMVTGLNLIRTAAFDQFLRKYPNATNAELTAWADWVNVASGRGNLGKAAAVANGLGFLLFAPRFAWSRVQTPLRIIKHWKEPRVRKEIAKDYAATIAVGITAMTLADYAGFQVGLDPREPDFGKIRIGNTKVDIWAGVQQPVRTVIRMVLTGTDRAGLTGRHLLDREKQVSPVDLATRFATFKLSPIITSPVALITGKTVVGEKVTPSDVALEAIMPLVLGDVIDAYRDEGLRKAGLVAGFTFFGMGANTYKDSKSRTRRDIARLERQGNHAGAKIKQMQWNFDNPQSRIMSVKTIVADTIATFRFED